MKGQVPVIESKSMGLLFGVLFVVALISLVQLSSPAYSQYSSTPATPSTPSTSSTPSSSSSATVHMVNITVGAGPGGQNGPCVVANNCFNPSTISIVQGDTVSWWNNDTATHTVTSGHPSDALTGTKFDQTVLPGSTVSLTFNNPGTMSYFCKIHPWLVGQVVVGPPSIVKTVSSAPLWQLKSGILAKNVTCKDGFQLLLKTEDGSPACVSPSTAQVLVPRGWGTFTSTVTQTPVNNTSNSIKVSNTNFAISYTITGGKVEASVGISGHGLSIPIQTTGDGVLTLDLSRALIDAKASGQDAKFVVLNDGEEVSFDETNTTQSDRMLSIPFVDGTQKIEIIGTLISGH